MRAKFHQKILNCRIVFRKNIWFLKNNRALFKFLYGILHYLISIMKLYYNQSIKNNFISTTQATLRDSLAIALLFGHFVLGVQIILLTNFENKH